MVGFIKTDEVTSSKKLRKGILNPADSLHNVSPDMQAANRINALYARDYKVTKDIRIISRSLAHLGRSS
ncbi:MAG: hypothetical protein IPP71_17645 [Bacteroidetes bacterium]|nr:hypothetical protein [Bacteroidota bacterium]